MQPDASRAPVRIPVKELKSVAMAARKTNPKVDAFIANAKAWREELKRMRAILLDSELTEDFKWSQPCYTFQGKMSSFSAP
jgi:hypothetical protein